ncbi:hypothetical protein [Streptosporangium sp. CA-115845]|uniref:hypothetical protein n=1 Tax=Streptosporangium sp. CA-115845 TaxID=3240071 RepID=UPI003D8ED970
MSKAFHRFVAWLRSLMPTAPSPVGELARKTALRATVLGGVMALTLSSAPVSLATQAQALTWTVPMSGIASGAGHLNATHVQAGWSVSCNTVEAKVRAHRGTGMTGDGVIAITGVMFGSADALCAGPLGLKMEVTVDTLPLKFDATAFDARTGMVAGRVSGITVTVESSNGCVLTIAGPNGKPGQADASYSNPDGTIVIDDRGHLRVTAQSSSCNAGIQIGDSIVVDGRFELTPRGILTSP